MKYLERDDIQGIVTNGYGKFEAAYGLYRISDAVRARRWLDGISDKVSSADPEAENQRQGFRLQIAFTYPGLGKLGLDEHAFADVSAEFIEPRDLRSHRQRVLQEFEKSGPQHWNWGGDQDGKEAVHILLALFAEDRRKLEELFDELVPGSIDSGLERIKDVHYTNRLPGGKEHFGFRDGISQPAIVDGDRRPVDAVSAGEFLFGYENEYGCYPAMPATRDNPDFGLNGTFLVARQLEQNVPKFWQDTMAAVNEDEKRARLLASRRVGRWPNGAPLIFAPRQETLLLAKENEFGYGKDPFGKRCPIGAHVRRANPRDSLAISQDDPTREVRRHRIIRRGRTYGDAIDGAFSIDGDINIDKLKSAESGGRGLFFICLNTDIGRQFEFILQTWVNNPKFAGGYEEVDPLFKVDRTARNEREDQEPALPNLDIATLDIGADAGGVVSTAGSDWKSVYTGAARSDVADGSDPKRPSARHYIRVRGGGYFFLPGLKAIRYLAQLGEQQSDRYNDPASDALEKIPPNEDFHTERLVRALTDKV
ncbi:MAG: hypothetical protein HKP32_02435, partial [Woeseia sp.]|nr:hypothetical protein [Woeseia sp.]